MRRGTVRAQDDTTYLDKRIRRLTNDLNAVKNATGSSEGGIDGARLEALEARMERLEEGRVQLAQRMQGQLLSVKGQLKKLTEAVAKVESD